MSLDWINLKPILLYFYGKIFWNIGLFLGVVLRLIEQKERIPVYESERWCFNLSVPYNAKQGSKLSPNMLAERARLQLETF